MEMLTQEDIASLMREVRGRCVSLYLSTHAYGRETLQDRIEFKNLLLKAEKSLVESGLSPEESSRFVAPARRFLQHSQFWTHQASGLAVFISPGTFRYFRLPMSFQKIMTVSDRFDIWPLLPLFIGGGRYFVLSLSKKGVKLFDGTPYGLSEITVPSMPTSIAAMLKYEVFDNEVQHHSTTSPRLHAGSAVYHGRGIGVDDIKGEIFLYFQKVDAALTKFLANSAKAPLVLAGVDYLIPQYRKASTYQGIAEKSLAGNYENVTAEKLHELSWKIAAPYLQSEKLKMLDVYRKLRVKGSKIVSQKTEDILPAALDGRVGTLFISSDTRCWGVFGTDGRKVLLHRKEEPGDSDLVNVAALHTLAHGGKVYTVESGTLADNASLGAVLRY